jgi:hypothetical protein
MSVISEEKVFDAGTSRFVRVQRLKAQLKFERVRYA